MGEGVATTSPEVPRQPTRCPLLDSPAAQRTCQSATQRLASRKASPSGTWAFVWWMGWRRCGTDEPPLNPTDPPEPGRLMGEEQVEWETLQAERSGPKSCVYPGAPRDTRPRCWKSSGRVHCGTWWPTTQTAWAPHSGRSAACCWGRRGGTKEARSSCWSSMCHPRYTHTNTKLDRKLI